MKQTRFDVVQMKVAKEMIRMGCECIGVYINQNDFMIYQFDRTETTHRYYKQARKNIGLDK